MKRISIVGLLMLLTACSTHAVKCHGSLRPINQPRTSPAKPVPDPARSRHHEN